MIGLAGALGGFAAYSFYSIPHMAAEGEPGRSCIWKWFIELKNPSGDCQDPACHDNQEMFRLATQAVQRWLFMDSLTYRKGSETTCCIHSKGKWIYCEGQKWKDSRVSSESRIIRSSFVDTSIPLFLLSSSYIRLQPITRIIQRKRIKSMQRTL